MRFALVISAFFLSAAALADTPEPTAALPSTVTEFATAPTPAVGARPAPTVSAREDAFLKRMPLRKKIGQLLIVGFIGTQIGEGLDEILQNVSPGGLIVFGRNITEPRQISQLLIDAQKSAYKNSRLPLLIATDQEGGDVLRIKTAMPLPSALALGKAGRPDIALAGGYATGKLLKTIGFNMDLAPVLDVSSPNQRSFIGTRTFGHEPELVAQMGMSFSEGLIKAGVLPTGKHFPGHGGVMEDSHLALPSKPQTLEELREADLVPFAKMQSRFPDRWATMLAHVAYPHIDASGVPATLSKKIVSGVLRQEMGFGGLVITDDINMAGVAQVHDARERVLLAIEAGADMVVVAWNRRLQHNLIDAIEKSVHDGRIPVSRIDESLRRIYLAKRTYAAPKLTMPSDEELQLALRSPTFYRVGDATIMARFKQAPEKEGREFQQFAAGKSILVFSANERFGRTFRDALADQKSRSVRLFRPETQRPQDIAKILGANPQAVGVFYVSGMQAAKMAGQLSQDLARRVLLVTVETPSNLANAESFRCVVDVYYRHPNLGKMIAERYFAGVAARPEAHPDLRAPASNKTAASERRP